MKSLTPPLALTLVALLALPGIAAAQDTDKWTGAYFGGFASSFSYEETGKFDDGTSLTVDAGIATLSGFAGYDKQISPQFVIGGEVGINLLGTEDEVLIDGLEYALDSGYWIRGRAGVVAESMLIYGALGLARYNSEVKYRNVTLGEGFGSGPEFGLGIEFMVRDKMSVRVEYTTASYESDESDELTISKFGAGVAYRF